MVVLVVVLVTEVGGRERKWRLRPQPRWRQRVRGSGAKAAGSCSLSSSPSAAWRGERELQVPAGGVRGVVARSFVCSWKRPGRKACYFFGTLSFLSVTGFRDTTTTTRAQCGSGAFFVCGLRPCSI